MALAEQEVVATHQNNSIFNVAKLMQTRDFRRIPVTDAGTGRLEGLVVAIDVIDFLGGGEKSNIIKEDYHGNFFAAINCPINKIMRQASFVTRQASISDVVSPMVEKHTSAIPVVEDEDSKKVIALVTERDVLPDTDSLGVVVADAISQKPITASPAMMLSDVAKAMVRNHRRRLPVVSEGRLAGVVTVFDILGYLGKGDFKGADVESNMSTRVEEVMSKDLVTVAADDDLAKVAHLVKETNLGGFPVVENGNLVGVVTTTDVIAAAYQS